jgi:hypothetical protein
VSARILTALCGLLLAVPALAESEHGGGGGEGLLFPWINFALLIGVLVYVAR